MRKASDDLCQEYHLSVIEDPQPGKSKHYGEWRAEQEQRPTWRGMVRADVDEAIRQSMTERQFFDALRKKGYEIKVGKDISVRPPGKERFVRLVRNFGEEYSIDGIRERMLCSKNGINANGYDFSRLPDDFREADPQSVRAALSEMRDTMNSISGRMVRVMEQNKAPKVKDQER